MQSLLLISIFGWIGVLCRFGIDRALAGTGGDFPAGIFAINILGSFLAGLIFVLGERQMVPLPVQMGALVGFCGAFTTFSTYSLQVVLLLEKGRFLPAILYFGLSPLTGIGAAYASVLVARWVLR